MAGIRKRQSYIVGGAFKNYLGAAVLTMLSAQFSETIGAIIIGEFICSEALAAQGTLLPLFSLGTALQILFVTGAGVGIAKMIGNLDYERASNRFTAVLIAQIAVSAILTALMLVFKEQLMNFLCDDEKILPYLEEYLSVFAYLPICLLVGYFASYSVELSGNPRVASIIVLVQCVLEVIFNLLFVTVLKMEMTGAALALTLGFVAEGVLGFSYLRKNKYFKLQKVKGFFHEIKETVRDGSTLAVSDASFAVLIFLLNTIVLTTLGTVGMDIWAILMQLLEMGMMIFYGIDSVTVTLGSLYMGEHDYKGATILYKYAYRVLIIGVLIVSVFIFLFPHLLLNLFGANQEMFDAGAETAVRIFIITLIIYATILFTQSLLVVVEHHKLGFIVNVTNFVCLLAGVYVASKVVPQQLWVGFPVGTAVCLAITLVCIAIAYRRNKGTTSRFLIPLEDTLDTWESSMSYDLQEIGRALSDIDSFLKNHNTEEEKLNKCLHVVDELSKNIVQYATKNKASQRYDIRIKILPEEVVISLKDDGRPFNPTLSENYEDDTTGENPRFGLKIVNNLGVEIIYQYMYGQNTTNVVVKK